LLKIILKIAISVALIGWLSYGIDGTALAAGLSRASLKSLVTAFVVLFALSAIQAYRWVLVAHAMGVALRFPVAWSIVLIGLFFNQTLPSSIGGDAARVWRLRRAGVQVGLSIRTVVLDRLVALLALLVIVAAGLPALLDWIGDQPLRWAVPALLVLGFCGFFCLLMIDTPAVRRWLGRSSMKQVQLLGRGAHSVFLRPFCLLPALSLSVFIHAVVCASVLLIGIDIGLQASFWQILVLFPPVLLLSMVPFSVAGWGVREGAMITALGLIGVPAATAFTVSILYGVVMVVVGLAGGIVWLATGKQQPVPDGSIGPLDSQ